MTNIDANVEAVVIPIRLMIPTPLASFVHLGDVAIDLPAVLAVTADVAVDSGSLCLKPLPAVIRIIMICASGDADGKY